MSLPPQKMREVVFQVLYSKYFGSSDWEGTAELIMENLKVAKKYLFQAQAQTELLSLNLDKIDALIQNFSKEYQFDRIASVEKTILRLCIYEIKEGVLPPKIALSEAVRLARKFGTPESARFVNGLLDAVYHDGSNRQEIPSLITL